MTEVNTSAAIVLLPTTEDWCKQDFPHTTLVYLGDIVNLKSFLLSDLLKIAYRISKLTNPVLLKVSGVDVFGEEEKVDVIRLVPTPQLLSIRDFFIEWDDGSFPDFKPHATIGPAFGSRENIPMMLMFDRICVWWGDEKNIFWLNQ